MKSYTWWSLLVPAAFASRSVFSVFDDVLAFPQYQIVFSESYISEYEAQSRLAYLASKSAAAAQPSSQSILADSSKGELSDFRDGGDQGLPSHAAAEKPNEDEYYEPMTLDNTKYLCTIPQYDLGARNNTSEIKSPVELERELAQATERGRELLHGMDRCIYFISGWWSYSFCYNNQVKQFHQLPPGNGAPQYPPAEDPTTPSFILGKFGEKIPKDKPADARPGTDVALQTKGESRYLVQKLTGGTICDLTGKPRRIEVQFHCHPQSTGDRIGWIKEVTTCSYLMVIYTPRLCNDVAFLPPREDKANPITCQEIVPNDKVGEWHARVAAKASRLLVNAASETRPFIGGIEVGAMTLVGTEGKRIEKGKVASSNPESHDVVAKSEGGEVKRLSKADLKKMDLDPETVEALKKRLQDMAGDKDWKLEVIDRDGVRELRGVVQADSDELDNEEGRDSDSREAGQGEQGSQEEFKEEL